MVRDLLALGISPPFFWWLTRLGPERLFAVVCAVWHPKASRRREARTVLGQLLSNSSAEQPDSAPETRRVRGLRVASRRLDRRDDYL
ncbi:hypothetical protein [Nocardia miyunensis]|uniref:hypothetical protein n=1 Tax=Nocardia miyunensis TaxID=282684 RepID=UPI000830CD5F|nr:hypothetical protein [Nocardia miyunensis]